MDRGIMFTFPISVVFLALLQCSSFGVTGARNRFQAPANVTATAGLGAGFRCRVKLHECGNFHSIEWYRESLVTRASERVYVYRHLTGVAKSENAWQGRATHRYDSKHHVMHVGITKTHLDDEAFYRCEITYQEHKRWFKDSCQSSQVTKLIVNAKPDFMRIENEDGVPINNQATIGPFNEGSLLVLRCVAGGGKPTPQVKIKLLRKTASF